MSEDKEKELLYDKEIAPILAEVNKRCKELGWSFAASVEWAPGNRGMTYATQEDMGTPQLLATLAVLCNGNIDSLINSVLKRSKVVGHNSVYLSLLERTFGSST